ncbi:MAG: GyrI-like domain-containing protein [Bacteroidota bacterium]
MEPRIETFTEKKLIGQRIITSLTEHKTFELWQGFMQRRKEIENSIGTDLYSVQTFNDQYWANFNPANKFEKWAAIEVKDHNSIPDNMEAFTIQSGLYAVFIHKGLPSEGPKTFQYIFGTWLPNSTYQLDDRPHFAVMGDKYSNTDPASEEELWIPVMLKK